MKTKLTKHERDTLAGWRWEIRSCRESIASLQSRISQLNALPMRSRDPIQVMQLRGKVGDYRTIVRSRQQAIKQLKEACGK